MGSVILTSRQRVSQNPVGRAKSERCMRRLPDGLTLIEVVLTPLLMSIVVVGAVLLSAGPVIVFAGLCLSIPIIVISWSLLSLLRTVVNASHEDLASPQTIATVPTDFHAESP